MPVEGDSGYSRQSQPLPRCQCHTVTSGGCLEGKEIDWCLASIITSEATALGVIAEKASGLQTESKTFFSSDIGCISSEF